MMAAVLEHEPAAPVAAFTISMARSAVLEALQRAVPVASKTTTLPVLNMVLLEANGGDTPSPRIVRLTTTDLERYLETTFAATTTGSGRALLPAKRLLEIVQSFPAASVVAIEANGKKARVSAGRSRFDLLGLAVDEFPLAPNFVPKIQSEIDAKAFVTGLARVAPFVSKVQGSPRHGALLEAADDGLYLITCDSPRLGRVKFADVADFRAQCILPEDTFTSIRQLFGADETLRLTAGASQVRLEGKHSALSTRLLEGPYPPYRMLIGYEAKVSVIAYAAELVNTVKRVALAAPDDNKAIAVYLHEKELHVVAQSSDTGRARDVLECRYVGDVSAVKRFTVNARYLTSIVEGIGADEKGEIALQLCGGERPIYVRPASTLTGPSLGICMPIRLLADIPDEE
jgi:DNA polymerase-3 subunit beta